MPSNHVILCHPLRLLPSIFLSIRVFLMSQLFTSGDQSIGASASASVLPMNQFSSVAQLCLTLCDPMDCSTPGLPVHHQLPEFTQTHIHWSVMPSSHLILCHPLSLLPLIPPSIRVFCCSVHWGACILSNYGFLWT